MKGAIPDPQNLFRDCNKHDVEDPRLITPSQLHLEVHICNLTIAKLHKTAPQKRREHLNSCIKAAEAEGDDDKKKALITIITKEANENDGDT